MNESYANERRPLMDIGADVPNGAEIVLRRKRVDPATGEANDVTARWTHGAAAANPQPEASDSATGGTPTKAGGEPRYPFMDVAPVPAGKQMQSEPVRREFTDPQRRFQANVAAGADRFGIGRSAESYASDPVNPQDTRAFLERRMGDFSIDPGRRQLARERLAILDENDRRSSRQASAERVAGMAAAGEAARGQAEAQSRLGAELAAANGRIVSSNIEANSRIEATRLLTEQRDRELSTEQKIAQEKNAAYLEERRLIANARNENDELKLRKALSDAENRSFGTSTITGRAFTIADYIHDTYDVKTGALKPTRTTVDGYVVENKRDPVKEARLDYINELRARLRMPPLFQRAEDSGDNSLVTTPGLPVAESELGQKWDKTDADATRKIVNSVGSIVFPSALPVTNMALDDYERRSSDKLGHGKAVLRKKNADGTMSYRDANGIEWKE